jgi:hypothetical protein
MEFTTFALSEGQNGTQIFADKRRSEKFLPESALICVDLRPKFQKCKDSMELKQ